MSQSKLPPTIILDSCVLINLLAGEAIEEILRATGKECQICVVVEKESFFLRTESPREEAFEPVELDALIESGVLQRCNVAGDQEIALYVDYASRLDDGEAMSLAIAESRGYIFATDDRKARRIFLESIRDSGRLLSTSDLIRNWTDHRSISPARLQSVLIKIQNRANFFPPRNDPNISWWKNACGDSK
ncbi:MAG: hypothetical protein SF339_18115 [Blastocatellia bacterium]|nr:hypothetical protein [Blastocatellia bacterium]